MSDDTHPIESQTSADVLQVILLVGTSQFLPDLLHLMVFIVHLRLLGQVLVFEILQLCHGLIYDLHVPLLFLLKQIKLSERALGHDHETEITRSLCFHLLQSLNLILVFLHRLLPHDDLLLVFL